MKIILISLLIIAGNLTMSAQNFSTQIIELGSSEFSHYYYSEKSKTNDSDIANLKERFNQKEGWIILEKNNQILAFKNQSDYKKYELYQLDSNRLKPRHLFYNLNKYNDQLTLNNSKAIIDAFLKKINCEEASRINQIRYVINYAKKEIDPILFYRENIAEFTLLVYLFYLENIKDLEYQLKYEDSTYIPYLKQKNKPNKDYFVLAEMYEDLFINNDIQHITDYIEHGFDRLNR